MADLGDNSFLSDDCTYIDRYEAELFIWEDRERRKAGLPPATDESIASLWIFDEKGYIIGFSFAVLAMYQYLDYLASGQRIHPGQFVPTDMTEDFNLCMSAAFYGNGLSVEAVRLQQIQNDNHNMRREQIELDMRPRRRRRTWWKPWTWFRSG
jgi:hypothetical protein